MHPLWPTTDIDEHLLINSMGAYMFMCESENASLLVMPDSLQPLGLEPTGLLSPWDFPGKNTAVGSHSLFQGTFLTQGLNPGLLHCRKIFYCLSHQGNPHVHIHLPKFRQVERIIWPDLRRQEDIQEWCGNLGWRKKDWIIERRHESVGHVDGRRDNV